MKSLPVHLAVLMITAIAVSAVLSERILGADLPLSGGNVRQIRPPGKIVTPRVPPAVQPKVLPKVYPKVYPKVHPKLYPKPDSSRLQEALQNRSNRVVPGQMTNNLREIAPAIKDFRQLNTLDKERFQKLDLEKFRADGAFQSLHERLQNPDIDRSLREMIASKDLLGRHQPDAARGILIIPGKLIVVWRPLWWRPYPYFVPVPVSYGPVPICVHGSSSPVIVQSPASDAQSPSDAPPKPDLAIILAHCLLPSVIAGQDVGPVMQIATACLSVAPLDGVAVDVFLAKESNPARYARAAAYSPRFADGVLLKDGRELVSFPGHGLLNVPMTGALTIPPDTPSGDYYLGVVIDPENRVAESDETNNIQFVPLRVVAPGQTAPQAVDR
jgi:hypothetical protein